MNSYFLIGYIAFIVVMSIITFFLYLSDNNKAKEKKWRVKESVLLGMGFLGGAVGGLLAMKIFRHKTLHWYFWFVNFISLIIHITIPLVVCLYVL